MSNRRDFLRKVGVGALSLTAAGVTQSMEGAPGKPQIQDGVSADPVAQKIELLFLGTGAADWSKKYPPVGKLMGRGEVRGMTSMLVNGQILIDCGPTVLDVMQRYEVQASEITDILLTHTHADHFHKSSILAIANSRDAALAPLKFWGHPEALKLVPQSNRIETCPVEIGNTVRIHGFDITGLGANHAVGSSKEECLIYLIEGATKSVLYATDTAWLPTKTWLGLQRVKLDTIIWDATVGEKAGDYRIFSHNDLAMIRQMNRSLRKRKVLKPDAKSILTHMARTLHPSHEELERKLLPEGLMPAYDGMTVTV